MTGECEAIIEPYLQADEDDGDDTVTVQLVSAIDGYVSTEQGRSFLNVS